MPAKAQMIELCQFPGDNSSSTGMCEMLLIWLSAQLYAHPPSTPLPTALPVLTVQLWRSRAHFSSLLHMLTSSCLAQCGSTKYSLHHTGLQKSRAATSVFHTPAGNSLGESGCKVTAVSQGRESPAPGCVCTS